MIEEMGVRIERTLTDLEVRLDELEDRTDELEVSVNELRQDKDAGLERRFA